jgi:hypothetical protein
VKKQKSSFCLAEINKTPFLFLSKYIKPLEINWKDKTIKSYSEHEEQKRVYEDDKGFYYIDSSNSRTYIPEEEIIEYDEMLFYNEKSLILQNQSYFKKANKHFIIFLKFFPLALVFLLSFRIPINFNALWNIANDDIGFIQVFDLPKIISLFLAVGLVYIGYKYRDSMTKVVLLLIISYIVLFYLSFKIHYFFDINKNLIVSLFFIWSIKEMYFVYINGYFDKYYYLTSIGSNKVIYRRRFLGFLGIGARHSILKRFWIGGHFFRVIEDE